MSKITEGGAGIGRVTSIRSGRKTVSGIAHSLLPTGSPSSCAFADEHRANGGSPASEPASRRAPLPFGHGAGASSGDGDLPVHGHRRLHAPLGRRVDGHGTGAARA